MLIKDTLKIIKTKLNEIGQIFTKKENIEKVECEIVYDPSDPSAEIRAYEKEFLEQNLTFDFFGFLNFGDEIPVFVEKSCEELEAEIVYPYTPTMLKYCVKNLTKESKISEASDLDFFKEKCNIIAKKALYQEESWEDTINYLSSYIKEYSDQAEKEL